jgi:hypothetical protein
MGPIIAFFLFLSITITLNISKLQESNTLPSQQAQEQLGDDNALFSYKNSKNSIFNPFDMMQMFLVLGFLMMGLVVGNSLGSKAAGAAQKLVTKTGKGVQGYMSRKATQGVGWAGGGALAGISAGLSKVPVLGGLLSRPVGVAGRSLEAKGEKVKKDEVEKAGKRIGHLSLKELNERFSTLTRNEQTAAIEKAMKAEKIPDNMKDVAMKLAKQGQIDEKALLKVDPTLRSDWQPDIKKIAKLEKEKEALESVSIKDEAAIQNKEKEINSAKAEFNERVSKTYENSKPAEISAEVSKLAVSVMGNEKIPEGVRDVFINRAADLDPIKIAATLNKITELPQKATFSESVLKIRMGKVSGADKLSGRQKFEALDPTLKRIFSKNPGLREMGFMEDFGAKLEAASKDFENQEKEKTERVKDVFRASEDVLTKEAWQTQQRVEGKEKEARAAAADQTFKDALKNLREERKIEAEDKKTLHEDIKNKGLDADSLHQTEE